MDNVIDLTGYRYARQAKKQDSHTYDALMYTLGKSVKRTTTLEWIGVSERLPEPGSRRWFAVILEHVGCQRSISGSQFINGQWAHIRDAFVEVTHWAELPKDLYFS
jgi:hypothetical protein